MKTILLAASLLLFALVPVATASPGACTPPVSQFGVCVVGGCAIVDGPAMHREACTSDAGDLISIGTYCTPHVSQFGACVGFPCSVVDGPAMHRVVCLPVLS